MFIKPTNYCAYLLRCWMAPARTPQEDLYRFSLEDPHTGEQFSFAGLDALTEFLRARLADDGQKRGDE